MSAETIRRPQRLKAPLYPYDEKEARLAWEQWGCNCGPSALATMLGLKLDDVHHHIPYFDERRYTSPTMMKDALVSLGVKFTPKVTLPGSKLFTIYGLCRIQWEGPWTKPGVNPKWAYRQTHWVGAMLWEAWNETYIFDVNSGWSDAKNWASETVPLLTKETPRATGDWFVTHRWELHL